MFGSSCFSLLSLARVTELGTSTSAHTMAMDERRKTLIFGDSLAHGFMVGGRIFNMAHALKEILDHASAEVTEEGMGGETATEMSSRLQATLGKSDNARRGAVVTHVVLWAGTNDLLDPMSSADSIMRALMSLVKICGAGRAVHLCTLHASEEDINGGLTAKREEVNERMKGMSNVVILDLANASLELGSDGVHLSKRGYMRACELMADSVKK